MAAVEDEKAPFGFEDDGVTPKAPYGLKADGTPKKLPGRPSNPFPKAPAAKKSGGGGSKAKAPDYTEGILGLFQIPAMGLALAGGKNPVLAADAAAVTAYAPGIAQALNQVAQEQPAVAAVLDRVLSVGPYGAVLAAALPLGLQLAVNHGLMPAGLGGTVPKETILAHAEHQAAQLQEQMAAAAASAGPVGAAA